jgi:hypothetical protein
LRALFATLRVGKAVVTYKENPGTSTALARNGRRLTRR